MTVGARVAKYAPLVALVGLLWQLTGITKADVIGGTVPDELTTVALALAVLGGTLLFQGSYRLVRADRAVEYDVGLPGFAGVHGRLPRVDSPREAKLGGVLTAALGAVGVAAGVGLALFLDGLA